MPTHGWRRLTLLSGQCVIASCGHRAGRGHRFAHTPTRLGKKSSSHLCCYIRQSTGIRITDDSWISKLVYRKRKISQRRRKHCALAVVRRSQNFSPRCRPLPGVEGRPKFNQLEMITTFTYNQVWWGSMHAISSYRGNRPTNTHTHRQDRLQYTAPHSIAVKVISKFQSLRTRTVHFSNSFIAYALNNYQDCR